MEENKDNRVEEASEETFDIEGFLQECLSRWKWFVASIFLFVAIAFFYCYRQTPQYEVTAAVYIQDNQNNTNSSLLLESLGLESYGKVVDNEIEVLRSKNLITDVVDSLKQYISYSWEYRFRKTPIYKNSPIVAELDSLQPRALNLRLNIEIKPKDGAFSLFVETVNKENDEEVILDTEIEGFPYSIPFQGGIVRLQYANDSNLIAGKTLCIRIENPHSVSRRIVADLSIDFASKASSVLNLVYSTTSIEAGKDFLNTLIDYYNRDVHEQKIRGAEKTQQFIDSRLTVISQELEQVEAQVENYRQQYNLVNISSEAELYLQQTGLTDALLTELEVQRNLVDYVEDFVKDAENEYTPIPILGVDDEGLSQLIVEYNKCLQQRERLLRSSSEDNPIVVEITHEAQTQRAMVLNGVESARAGLEIKKRDATKQGKLLENKIKNVPQYERELSDIMRQQRIKDNLYMFLLEKREENALTKNMSVPVARIIDDPDSTGSMVSPKKILWLSAAFLLGLLLPILIIYLQMTYFFPVVKDKKMLERLTGIPILTEIVKVANGRFFVVDKKSVEPIAELFRLLRNNLQFVLPGPDKKVITVTSSVMHEGKTFISCNMALSFALTGKRVLLIGTDIRRPRLKEHFNSSSHRGLTTYLADCDMTDVEALISPSGIDDNLDVIFAGPIPPNPNELLMNARFDELMQYVRGKYDYIILDTAPLGLVSDTFLLTRFSDVLLYVVRANYTYKDVIDTLNGWVRSKRLNLPVYLILNDVKITSRAYTYRRYGSYNSGYGYGTLSDTDKPSSLFRRRFKRNRC